VVGVGAATWYLQVPLGIAMLAGLVGFALAMVNIFKKQVSPALIMAVRRRAGRVPRRRQRQLRGQYRGIVVQAIVGTAAVFAPCCSATRAAAARHPEVRQGRHLRPRRHGRGAPLNLLAGAFTSGDPLGLNSGPIGILFHARPDHLRRAHLRAPTSTRPTAWSPRRPEQESWRVAFGLVVGLIFLYLNILRLLSMLQSD
jgi:uncharacterized YccA/Bax inhibitor family protein